MRRELAEQIVKILKERRGPMLTIPEAKAMIKVRGDGLEVYALTKGNLTFMAYVDTGACLEVKHYRWF